MQVEACTEFLFSRDGINSERLEPGVYGGFPKDRVAAGVMESTFR